METFKITQAKLLAQFVHCNQLRQDNEPYIDHCERVVYEVGLLESATEDLICAAFLHDVVEDGEKSISFEMIAQYFGDNVANIIIALTHLPRESYNQYITRVFQHDTAWQIKWADMIDNTSYPIPDEQKTKYREACIMLMVHGVTIPEILKDRLEL